MVFHSDPYPFEGLEHQRDVSCPHLHFITGKHNSQQAEPMALVRMSLLLPLRGCCPWISHFPFLSLHFLIFSLFPLLLLFIVLKYINKVDHFNHVLMYSCTVNDCLIYRSVAWSTFKLLCRITTIHFQSSSVIPKWNFVPQSASSLWEVQNALPRTLSLQGYTGWAPQLSSPWGWLGFPPPMVS